MMQSTKLLLTAAVLYLATHQATAEFFSLDSDNPQSRQPGIIGYDGEIPETPLLPSASLTNETTDVGILAECGKKCAAVEPSKFDRCAIDCVMCVLKCRHMPEERKAVCKKGCLEGSDIDNGHMVLSAVLNNETEAVLNPEGRQPGMKEKFGYDGEIPETALLPLTNETTDVGHRALAGDYPPYVTKCKEDCPDGLSKKLCERLCTLCYLTCEHDEPMQVMACFEEKCSFKSASSLANTGQDSNSKRRRMMECRDCAAYQNDREKMKKCRDHCLGKPMNSDDGSTTKTIAEPYLRGV